MTVETEAQGQTVTDTLGTGSKRTGNAGVVPDACLGGEGGHSSSDRTVPGQHLLSRGWKEALVTSLGPAEALLPKVLSWWGH